MNDNGFSTIGKYLCVQKLDKEKNKKTDTYLLYSGSDVDLGLIKWYSRWRQYCFYPEKNTIFNSTCLNDISKFLETINKKKRENDKRI